MKLWFYKSDCKSAKMLDKVIGIFSYYSHVEVQFSDGMSFSSSPRDGGCRFKQIEYNPEHWDIVEVEIHPQKEIMIRNHCISKAGYKYDYIGALTSILPFCIQKNKKYFCSEIVANILNEHGVLHIGDGCRYSPSELYNKIKRR